MLNYSDIVPDYSDYLNRQITKYMSHERDNQHWEDGQKRYILNKFNGYSRDMKILDIACGDGVGLRVFRELGFRDIIGVEYQDDKIANAKLSGYPVIKADMHDLSVFSNQSFDIVYSSHTFEHAYYPIKVLKELYRILKSVGILQVVLPFIDIGPDDAHGGKYELKTYQTDPMLVVDVFKSIGFKSVFFEIDSFREPELWVTSNK